MDTTEKWYDVVGYEGFYRVSDRGQVASVPRTVVRSDGRTMKLSGRLMKPHVTGRSGGSTTVNLHRNAVMTTFTITRLLLIAATAHDGGYLPSDDSTAVAAHIDGNVRNNRLDNLRWLTRSEVAKKRFRTLQQILIAEFDATVTVRV